VADFGDVCRQARDERRNFRGWAGGVASGRRDAGAAKATPSALVLALPVAPSCRLHPHLPVSMRMWASGARPRLHAALEELSAPSHILSSKHLLRLDRAAPVALLCPPLCFLPHNMRAALRAYSAFYYHTPPARALPRCAPSCLWCVGRRRARAGAALARRGRMGVRLWRTDKGCCRCLSVCSSQSVPWAAPRCRCWCAITRCTAPSRASVLLSFCRAVCAAAGGWRRSRGRKARRGRQGHCSMNLSTPASAASFSCFPAYLPATYTSSAENFLPSLYLHH